MSTRDLRVTGLVFAAWIGLTLSTGYGVALADSSGSGAMGGGAGGDAKPASAAAGRLSRVGSAAPAAVENAGGQSTGRHRRTAARPITGVNAKPTSPLVARHPQTQATTSPQAVSVTSTATTTDATPEAAPPAPAATPTAVVTAVGTVANPAGGQDDSGAPAPAEPPVLSAALAWVRRQSQLQTTSPSGSGQTANASAVTTTGDSQDGADVTTINVKDYGAVGDGVTDDSAAIKAAEAALTSGERLYLPPGDYRFAQQNPEGEAAILLNGLSNVTVEFAPGARLLMDNLDAAGHGTSDGIRVVGAASNVTILNPTIEWVTAPSARSFGDGLSVQGWPSDSPPPADWTGSTGTVDFVSIVNGRVVNAPQTGAVVMGASDVTVTNFTAIDTLGDGLHFNADRRVTVDGLVAQGTGDDGLAFVTYYDPSQPWVYGPTGGPFNQPGLGDWNNGGSVASHITVTGGLADGVRVQGGDDITISDVSVTGKQFGVQVNSSRATGAGDWTSLASRDVHVSDVDITGAQTGIVLATNNIDGTEDPMWWDFSGLTISDVTIHGCTNWSVAVETPATATSKFAGVTLQNIDAEAGADPDGPSVGGNGGMLLASLNDSVIDNVRLVSDHASDIDVLGAGQLRSGVALDDLPASNLTVNGLDLEGPGRILVQDIAGVQFGNVASHGAQGSAVTLYRVKDATFDDITADLPGRGTGAGYGVQLLQVDDVDIDEIDVTTDDHVGSSWWAIELGGGTPGQIAGTGVRVGNVVYVSDRDATDSDIVVQGGPYGPVDWYINAHWLHQGEATPQWRSAVYGDTTSV